MAFIRFVIFGGGVGILAALAVALLAGAMPWALANVIVTAASTALCTELHVRYTFRKGRGAGWREHWQSAGSAGAAYLVTSGAMGILHLVQPAAGSVTEQLVYLGASGLAGAGRFVVLRLYVFATRSARPLRRQGASAVPVQLAA
ncbi:GtrA family protein [Streptomyces sp. NPDC057253]|uniref:GtrA family protein n=1 Tax=Streptomyces sp. NPDC057253 TaxID=3346069 RepID=UPI003635A88F